mmetsp:Transcript_20554/g.65597  ORF Transcript_20554/g.65597 Transcript_20554/m.65597 type:complete len:632 (+) Transcript_20554:151-2046(+)
MLGTTGTGMTPGVANWLRRKSAGTIERDDEGVPIMTANTVRALCMEHDGYECEELNDHLFLHFQGFREIGGLDGYTGLKSLNLESNAIAVVEGLGQLHQLRALFLQQNLIQSFGPDSFRGLSALVTLDVSQNMLQSLQGIEHLTALQSLNASSNRLETPESVSALAKCQALTCVDLQKNALEDDEAVLGIVDQNTNVSALYLAGNPLVKRIKYYRKSLVNRFPRLSYLDDRPVDPRERFLAAAFAAGGREAEAAARSEWNAKEQEQARAHMHSWREMRETALAQRQAELQEARQAGLDAPGPTRYVSYRTSSETNDQEPNAALACDSLLAASAPDAERKNETAETVEICDAQGDVLDVEKSQPAPTQAVHPGLRDQCAAPLPPKLSEDIQTKSRSKPTFDINAADQRRVAEAQIRPGHGKGKESKASIVEPALLKRLVRACKFDFEAVAQAVARETGVHMNADECRLEFAAARSSNADQHAKPPENAKTLMEARSSTQSTTMAKREPTVRPLAAETGDDEAVYGQPMPKVAVNPPVLPSVADYADEDDDDSDDDEYSENISDHNGCVSGVPVGGCCLKKSGAQEVPGKSSTSRTWSSGLPRPLTRHEILSGLHQGDGAHPLAAELRNPLSP